MHAACLEKAHLRVISWPVIVLSAYTDLISMLSGKAIFGCIFFVSPAHQLQSTCWELFQLCQVTGKYPTCTDSFTRIYVKPDRWIDNGEMCG